jgi:CheY-like chemotaxis protein
MLDQNKYNFIVADDDEDDQLFITDAIKGTVPGVNITTFNDGAEAVSYLLSNKISSNFPHLIFLDLNMRKLDGRTALTIIKKDKRLKEVPVVILTTSNHPKDKEDILLLGASEFLTKPSTVSEMRQMVATASYKWLGELQPHV